MPSRVDGILFFYRTAGDIVPAAQRSGTSSPSGESPGVVCRETPLHAAGRRLEGRGLARETDKTQSNEKPI
jgi:hypothetical protein